MRIYGVVAWSDLCDPDQLVTLKGEDDELHALDDKGEFGVGDWADWSDEVAAIEICTAVNAGFKSFMRRRGLVTGKPKGFLFTRPWQYTFSSFENDNNNELNEF